MTDEEWVGLDLACPSCQKSVRVPADPQGLAGRRAKCMHCRTSFEVPATPPASAAPAVPAAPPVPPVPPPGQQRVSGKVATLARASGREIAPDDPTILMVPSAGSRSSAKVPILPPGEHVPRRTGKVPMPVLDGPASRSTGKVPVLDGAASRSTGKVPALDGPASRSTGKLPALEGPASRSTGKIPLPRTTGTVRVVRPWGTCASHPGETSTDFCETCNAGWCANCTRPVPGGKCCNVCQHPTIPASEKKRQVERDALRARPLSAELQRVLRYPLSDPLGFAILAVLVGFFSAARGMSMGPQVAGFAYVLGQGLVMGYAFTALRRVAQGNLTAGMPDMTGLDDLVRPVRLSAAAFLIAALPILVVVVATGYSTLTALASRPPRARAHRTRARATPPAIPTATESGDPGADPNQVLQDLADQAQTSQVGAEPEPETGAPARAPAWAPFAITLSLLWMLGYFPVAFMVAAISQSVWATLDPREGVRAISVMGGTYWQAAGVAALLFACCGFARKLAWLHPVTGFLVGPVVECYQWLAVGCLLGLAIFKRAPELGFD